MENNIFTIGYSTLTFASFLELLKKYKITAVCDVRSVPFSKRYMEFDKPALKKSLKENGITYLFMGEELGARSDDPNCYVDGKVDYYLMSRTILFRKGLDRLRKGMQKGFRIALMCAEKDPATCHRSILITKNLRTNGLNIQHILQNGRCEEQGELEERIIKESNLHYDFFGEQHSSELIEKAYQVRGKKIAYEEKTFESVDAEQKIWIN